jgi:hypothetical protein
VVLPASGCEMMAKVRRLSMLSAKSLLMIRRGSSLEASRSL